MCILPGILLRIIFRCRYFIELDIEIIEYIILVGL